MAYLSPHFEQDVFVSFSHGDPLGTGKSPLKEWTFELLSRLEVHIRAIDPEFQHVVIWRDEELDPTLHLTPELKAKVKSAAILFIVMSPHYLKSRWCSDELTWFREQIQDRAQDPKRVFIIRAVLTDVSKWPEFLRDERGFAPRGFSFHDPQNDTPYCWDGSRVDYDAYQKCLNTLRTTLIKRLRELRDRAGERKMRAEMQAAPRYTRSGPRRIYLHARTEDAPICLEVQDRLSEVGFYPVIDMTVPGEELRDWRRQSENRIETAKDFDALALIRAKGDANFRFTLRNIGRYDREEIQQARGAPLPCAVLDQSGEELPIDVSGWGVEHFDLHNNNWSGEFRQWLDKAEARPVAAQL